LFLRVKLQDGENKDGGKNFNSRSRTHLQSTTPYVGPHIIISGVTPRSHNNDPDYWILLEEWKTVRKTPLRNFSILHVWWSIALRGALGPYLHH